MTMRLDVIRPKWKTLTAAEARAYIARQLGLTEHQVHHAGEIWVGSVKRILFTIKGYQYIFDPDQMILTRTDDPRNCL